MPIYVRDNGAEQHRLTLDVAETQVLIAVDGLPGGADFEHHVLLARIAGTSFVTLDSGLQMVGS